MATILVRATPLQQAMRILSHAWMHLWSLTKSITALRRIAGDTTGEALESLVRDNTDAAFYYGKILSSRFFLGTVFCDFRGRVDGLLSRESAVADSFDVIFTGAPEQ
ncbi:MAG: hypothetical protein CVV44_01730 [Spirochaetae bacterium HGW-Spirochaetae-1]|jgi:hypothetical protein|nr:MAG: hypothetical protein CVV44_01730 [Spirochaetae bacterium HGW-Spirochaetae-1]